MKNRIQTLSEFAVNKKSNNINESERKITSTKFKNEQEYLSYIEETVPVAISEYVKSLGINVKCQAKMSGYRIQLTSDKIYDKDLGIFQNCFQYVEVQKFNGGTVDKPMIDETTNSLVYNPLVWMTISLRAEYKSGGGNVFGLVPGKQSDSSVWFDIEQGKILIQTEAQKAEREYSKK
jgi:hypothetical protein